MVTAAPVIGFTDATPWLNDPLALRQLADQEGYLFFRGLLDPAPLLDLRRQILTILDSHGWLRRDADLMEGLVDHAAIASTCQLDDSMKYLGVTMECYKEIQHLELFHAIPHDPKLIALYEALFGEAVLAHPRHIARILMPNPDLAATPPHQDYTHVQGTHNFWTCWFPLGDCPVELGGLSVLRGSHKEGVLPVASARGAGGKETILCNHDYQWVQGDYRCGDVITFPSHMIHRGLVNQFSDRTRLSLDVRYQPASEEVEGRSLLPHIGTGTWEDIYAGWKSDRYKYYWRNLPLKITEYDHKLVESKERIC